MKTNNTIVKENETITHKAHRGFRHYAAAVTAAAFMGCMVMTASAAGTEPLTVVNNLSDFIFGLIRAVGMIQSHDPSQRSNGFLTLAGGIIITFAKEILTMITG